MSNKITIIGAGQVGSTIAYALTLKQLACKRQGYGRSNGHPAGNSVPWSNFYS